MIAAVRCDRHRENTDAAPNHLTRWRGTTSSADAAPNAPTQRPTHQRTTTPSADIPRRPGRPTYIPGFPDIDEPYKPVDENEA